MIPKPAAGLPEPDAESLAHSNEVARHIRAVIEEAGGNISFAQFMHECLYAPGLGYYSAGLKKFGAEGDFVTAPEISPVFGHIVARQCAHILSVTGGDVLEFGAGSGALAVAVLEKLADIDCLPDRYRILEVSPELTSRQETTLREQIPELADRVVWIDELPTRFRGAIVANEVVDAIPAERFVVSNGDVLQARVAAEGENFVWRFEAAPRYLEQSVRDAEATLDRKLEEGFCSELSTGARGWLGDVAACLEHGAAFVIDYGVSRREYYAPDRRAGWLRCHFRHHAHDDPLILPGIQDITTWVDFTSLAEVATDRGLSLLGYATQGDFLVSGGLHEELSGYAEMTTEEQIELSGQVKRLTMPAEMGESFKCMVLGRGDLGTLPAFGHYIRTHSL